MVVTSEIVTLLISVTNSAMPAPMVTVYAKIATLTRTLRGAFGSVVSFTLKNSVGSRARTSPFSPYRSFPTDATRPIAPSTRLCDLDSDASSAAESLVSAATGAGRARLGIALQREM